MLRPKRKYEEICNLVSVEDALNYLGRYFNDIDFTQFALDEQFPELGDFARNGWESSTDRLKQMARDEKLTLRQMANRATTPKTPFMGTPERVADIMQEWFESGAADGFMLNGAVLPQAFDDFIDHVLPILKQRGLFRSEYEATTLRGNLGLAVPPNRYAREVVGASARA